MTYARRLRLCAAVAFCLGSAAPAMVGAAASSIDAASLERAAQARGRGQWLEALAIYERLQAAAPTDGQLYRLRTLTLADLGSADRAWALLQARPELFDRAERERLEADRIARLAVWGGTRPLSESDRLRDMRRAGDAAAQASGPDTARRQFDRLVILNGLEQHEQAAAMYRTLRDSGTELPPYALAAAGDSLLASRHPREAAEALELAVDALPDDIDTQVVLAYAYLESGRHADAAAHLSRIVETQPAWLRAPGARTAEPNWNRYAVETNLAMVHAYSEDPAGAEAMLAPMAAMAPSSADLQAKLGIVTLQRGRPTAALQRFEVAHTQDPRNLQARIGRVDALAELGRMRAAREAHDALLGTWPDNVHARRLHDEWRQRTGWQIDAGFESGRSDGDDGVGTSPLGSRDGGHDLAVYSPLLGDRWGVGAFRQERWAEFDEAGGDRVRDLRHGVGLRYRHDRLDWELQLARSDDRRSGPGSTDATGIALAAGWRFSDHWQVRAEAARNAAGASLQAREAGILADTAALAVQWQHNGRSTASAELRQWRYDDGNRRESLSLDGSHAVLVRPRVRLELSGQAYTRRGSRDDAPYFNPSHDGGWTVGAQLQTRHWQRYDHGFSQRFGLGGGQYWQDGFGSAWVPSAQYRHEWTFGYGRSLDYGVTWSRPVYDGNRERHLAFDIRFHWGE